MTTKATKHLLPGLVDINWWEDQLAQGGVGALLAAIDQAISRGDATTQTEAGKREIAQLQLIRAALLLDADWLQRHPETLFQCLWNRCWWHDHPSAADFYKQYEADAWGSQGPPWESDVGLHRLIEMWRDQKRTRCPDEAWLRSLRPPIVQLHGSLITAYQLPQSSNTQAISFVDAETIEISGTEKALWEYHQAGEEPVHTAERFIWRRGIRQSIQPREGEVKTPAYAAQTHPTPAIIAADTGQILAEVKELELFGDRLMVTRLDLSPDQTWLVSSGWIWDYDGAFAIYQLQSSGGRKPALRLSLAHAGELPTYPETVSFSTDSRYVAFAVGGQIEIYDLQSGTRRWLISQLPGTTSRLAIWLDPDDTLILARLTNDRQVQVWREPHLRRSTHRAGLGEDIGHIQFSPEGTWLYTQPWLWDGSSGALFANTHDRVGHYLEGGPPREPRYLTEEHIIQAEGQLTRYHIRRARLEDVPYPEMLFHGNIIAYDPSGEYLAIAHRRDQWLALVRLSDGEELRRWEGTTPTAMAFSHDGLHFLCAQDGEDSGIYVYRTADPKGEPRQIFRGHQTTVTDIVLSRDGALVISAGESEALCLWRLATGAEVARKPLAESETTQGTRYEHDEQENSTAHPYSRWNPTPMALAQLEGWEGFETLAVHHAWHTSYDKNSHTFCICLPDGEAVAWYPLELSPLPHPKGRSWASALEHIVLEGDPFASRRARIAAQQTEQLEAALFED